jgi:transaldolase/glucose-6-phosphate isomerase
MTNAIQELRAYGQSIWYDNIRRGLLTSGELARLVGLGVAGVTSNPTIFQKAIGETDEYDDDLRGMTGRSDTAMLLYERLAFEDIQRAADILLPVYDRTDGADGFVSLEVPPALAHDTDSTVAEATRLFDLLGRPNVMIKVPGTPAGIPAVRRLIAAGVNVNVTLLFSVDAYDAVMDAYLAGLEDRAAAGHDLRYVASVASFFVSRVDTLVDSLLQARSRQGETGLDRLMGRAAVANARIAYTHFRRAFDSERFERLALKGARLQRPLWASTSTKNPAYSDLLYVATLVAPDTVNTVPPATLDAILDHGHFTRSLEPGIEDARRTMAELAAAGIDLRAVTDQLLAEGVKAFADSFDKLLADIQAKAERLTGARAG